jgi:hypothetical protein
MYDRSKSVYEQKPDFFSIKKTDSGYILSKKTEIRTHLTKVSFAIQAVDRMNSSGSDDGIYAAQINVDSVPLVKFVIDSISYTETRYMNAQIDYKYRYNGGRMAAASYQDCQAILAVPIKNLQEMVL